MGLKAHSIGCSCCANATLVVPVRGCNGAVPPAGTVQVTLSPGGATATNNSAGNCTFSGLAGGTYTPTAQGAGGAAGRWTSVTGSATVVAGSGTTTAATINLTTPATGYVCGPTDCAVPWKTTLVASWTTGAGANVSTSLTYASGTYTGCLAVSCLGQNPTIHGACSNASVTSPVFLSLPITGLAVASLVMTVEGFLCDTTTNYAPTQGTCASTANYSETTILATHQCWPVSLYFYNDTVAHGGAQWEIFPHLGASYNGQLINSPGLSVTE